MSARACLLCGKPLSRIWVGSGEDFCSREHRNQYRLRRGMEHLVEANKVANVMRRRENPRPVDPARLIREGLHTARDFSGTKPFATPAPSAALARRRPARLGSPVRFPDTGLLRSLPAHGTAGPPQGFGEYPFPAPPRVDLSALGSPAPPAAAAFVRAPAVALAPAASVPALGSRLSGYAHLPASAGKPPVRIPRPPTGPFGDTLLAQSRPARVLGGVRAGRNLRVSMAAGFRVPGFQFAAQPLDGPSQPGSDWLAHAADTAISGTRYVEMQPGACVYRAQTVSPETHPALIPAAPLPPGTGQFRWPGMMALSAALANPSTRYRPAAVPFGDEGPGKERSHEYSR